MTEPRYERYKKIYIYYVSTVFLIESLGLFRMYRIEWHRIKKPTPTSIKLIPWYSLLRKKFGYKLKSTAKMFIVVSRKTKDRKALTLICINLASMELREVGTSSGPRSLWLLKAPFLMNFMMQAVDIKRNMYVSIIFSLKYITLKRYGSTNEIKSIRK